MKVKQREMNSKEIACLDGGMMIECYKDPGWGQVNIRVIPSKTTAGGHRHLKTSEWWMLLRGELRVTLEAEPNGPLVRMLTTGAQMVMLSGRGHAVENLGDEEAVLLFQRDRVYDPDDPDKEEWEWT